MRSIDLACGYHKCGGGRLKSILLVTILLIKSLFSLRFSAVVFNVFCTFDLLFFLAILLYFFTLSISPSLLLLPFSSFEENKLEKKSLDIAADVK